MKRRLAVVLTTVLTAGVMQLGMAAPASACQDPNCPWSPVTSFVYDTLYWVSRNCDWTVGQWVEPNPCP